MYKDMLFTLTDDRFWHHSMGKFSGSPSTIRVLRSDPEVILISLDEVMDRPPGAGGLHIGCGSPGGLSGLLLYDVT